jgi:hypothetical protein
MFASEEWDDDDWFEPDWFKHVPACAGSGKGNTREATHNKVDLGYRRNVEPARPRTLPQMK